MAKKDTDTDKPEQAPGTSAPQRAHKATYTRDKKRGGYNIWVTGPSATKFAGKTVPVTRKDGSETMEELEELQWSGMDENTGKPAAVYSFKPHPREEEEIEF